MSLVISGILTVLLGLAVYSTMRVRATPAETRQGLPGDDLIPQPVGSVNHAITIRCPRCDVWPWLVQMGSGRAGWYSYDFVDNGGCRSAERILPEHQNIEVGSVFPALPGARDVFVVVQYEPERNLVLAWRLPSGKYQTTWAFALEEPQSDLTRLMVRGRVAPGYRPYGLPQWLALPTGWLAHFVMQRRQLLGIARRAEGYGADSDDLTVGGAANGTHKRLSSCARSLTCPGQPKKFDILFLASWSRFGVNTRVHNHKML